MPFSSWKSYADLLDKLSAAEDKWGDADSFDAFDEKIRQSCADLVDGTGGYAELYAALTASGDYSDTNQLFAHVRIAALAAPADSELGPEWAGYWISRNTDDDPIYADSRYAMPAAWTPVSGSTETAAADEVDLTEQHVDTETGRWRRWNADDSEFEYYHDDDDAWERLRDGSWHRYHDVADEWLAYDAASGTWWYKDDWRRYDAIGAAPTVSFDWVTADQAGRLEQAWGDDWRDSLGPKLDERWGEGWAANPVEHRQHWLTGLLDDLLPTESEPAADTAADGDDDEEIDLTELAEQMVTESLAELADVELSPAEFEEAVAKVRRNLEEAMSGD